MATAARLQSFRAFWPFYLGEHRRRLTRRLHFVGTTASLALFLGAAVARRPWWLVGGVAIGYAFAWVGHFFVEHNRPATFTYPFWSFAADWKMWWLALTGRLPGELRRLGIEAGGDSSVTGRP